MIHNFDTEVAEKLGVNAAVIVANLAYLQANREAQGGEKYYMDGRWWVHHTYESLQKVHPYFSVQQIRRIMRGLLESGVIFQRNPDKWKRDSYWSVVPEFAHVSKSPDASVEIDSSQSAKSTVVLHDNNIEQIGNISTKQKNRKTPIPDDFGISDGVRKWAEANGHRRLNAHLENFIDAAKAKDYRYVNWDAAFKTAIRKNWADIK